MENISRKYRATIRQNGHFIVRMVFRGWIMNQRGFSLIEIMVAVAILAILATVAIPQYKSFQARARQKGGFALLDTYFASAQTTRAEFGTYPGNFVETGFQPVGELGYRLSAVNGARINLGWFDNACVDTSQACACAAPSPVACPNFKTWTEEAVGAANTPGVAPIGGFGAACGAVPALVSNNNEFSVRVTGWIGGSQVDAYGMDQTKNLQLCQDGIY